MSDRPEADPPSEDVLHKQSQAHSSRSSIVLEEKISGRPWSAGSIASSIVDTLTKSCIWLPNRNSSSHTVSDNKQEVVMHEYTSEQLEKALMELKSSVHQQLQEKKMLGIVAEKNKKTQQDDNMKIVTETKETMSNIVILNNIEISTEISYPANLEQTNQNVESKPCMEHVSTQSTTDRVKLNTQTTTEDLPQPKTLPKPLCPSLPIDATTQSQTEATKTSSPPPKTKSESHIEVMSKQSNEEQATTSSKNNENERTLRRSKVPVLRPDYVSATSINLNCPFPTTSNDPTKSNKIKFGPSKIPMRLSSSTSLTRGFRLNSKSEKQLNVLKIEENKETQDEMQKKLSTMKQFRSQTKLTRDNGRLGFAVQLQTDEVPPCGGKLSHNPSVTKVQKIKQKRDSIDNVCSNLMHNIRMVEDVLDKLPRDNAGKLAYALVSSAASVTAVAARDACTMRDDFQADAQCQSDLVDNDTNRTLYEQQVYKRVGDSPELAIEEENDDDYEDLDEENSNEEKAEKISEVILEQEKLEEFIKEKIVDKIEEEKKLLCQGLKNLASRTSLCMKPSTVLLCNMKKTKSFVKVQDKTVKQASGIEITAGCSTSGVTSPCKTELKPGVHPGATVSQTLMKTKALTPSSPTHTQSANEAKRDEICKQAEELKEYITINNTLISKEDLAYEVTVFNMIQSQKINNILRLAMPYNNFILPVFVSSPSSIMQSLEHELQNTLKMKRQASFYFNSFGAERCGASIQAEKNKVQRGAKCYNRNGGGGRSSMHRLKSTVDVNRKSSCCDSGSGNSSYFGSILGPQVIAQHQATWAKPPFYYGAYKQVPPKR